jgi:C-terminal processing protease CtpA/Prc
MSGIDINAILPGLPIYEIGGIWSGSPAAKAGLLPGDQIISINNMTSKNFALSDMVYLLQQKDGKKIKMQVRRNDKLVKAVFRLKKII